MYCVVVYTGVEGTRFKLLS